MAKIAQKPHPYIESREDYCGGSPVITGTKFPVRSVANYVLRQGMTPEISLLLDEDVRVALAGILRERGYDAVSGGRERTLWDYCF